MSHSRIKVKKSGSIILRRLYRAINRTYASVSKSFTAWLFCLYYTMEKRLGNSLLVRCFSEDNKFSGFLSDTRNKISEYVFNGKVTVYLKNQASKMPYVRTKDIGIYLISSGLYTLLVHFVKEYTIESISSSQDVLYYGGFLVLLSLLFMSNRPLISAVKHNFLFSFIVSDVFGVPESELTDCEAKYKSASIALLVGMSTGLVTFILPIKYIMAAFLCLTVLYLILRRPEAGIIIMLMFLPFLRYSIIASVCAATVLSYFIKVLCRKRSFGFTPIDLSVLLFMFLTACGNLGFSSGTESAVDYCLLICGYFLCRNLLSTRRWLIRAMKAAAVSAVVVSCVGVFIYIFGTDIFNIGDYYLLSGVYSGIKVFFGSPVILSSYLIMCVPFTIYMYNNRSRKKSAAALKAALFISFAAIFLTYNPGAWVGILIGVVAVSLIYSRKTVIRILRILPLCVILCYIPPSVYNFISANISSSGAGLEYKLNVMKGVLKMIADNPFGCGFSAFGYIYPQYSSGGYAFAESPYNMYLDITSVVGIIGLLSFLLIFYMYFSMNFTYLKNSLNTKSKNSVFPPMMSVCAILIQGLTNPVFDDKRIFLLFFAVLGIGAAACSLCREETEYKLDVTYGFAMYRAYAPADINGKEREQNG